MVVATKQRSNDGDERAYWEKRCSCSPWSGGLWRHVFSSAEELTEKRGDSKVL
jgi:hypothetical protein